MPLSKPITPRRWVSPSGARDSTQADRVKLLSSRRMGAGLALPMADWPSKSCWPGQRKIWVESAAFHTASGGVTMAAPTPCRSW